MLTGLSLAALMGLWQNTGVVIWTFPFRAWIVNGLSLVVFWGLLSASIVVMTRFDGLEFVGLKQLYRPATSSTRSEGMPRTLKCRAFHGWVRHPIYTFTTAAFVLTPS